MSNHQKKKGNGNYNVRNILVSKDKNSDFLEFYTNNELLGQCPFFREPFISGPYYVYTLDNVHEPEREIIRENQDEWIKMSDESED